MKKTGIMGGTFDPIHNGHLLLAQAARAELGLDEVRFLPSKNPPHKLDREITPEDKRCQMVKLAIQDIPDFVFSDMEIRRRGRTYTADTLRQLQKEEKHTRFYFIMGADSLLMMESWREPEVILSLAAVVAAVRDTTGIPQLEEKRKELIQKYGGEIFLLSMKKAEISSTAIRREVQMGRSIQEVVPKSVADYIAEEGLYQ